MLFRPRQLLTKTFNDWLNINGEAIYETRKWENANVNEIENVYFTKKGTDLYVHSTEFPTQAITINGISNAKK